jgi:hypothetical protein
MKDGKIPKVVITQKLDEPEIPAKIIAQSIVAIDEAIKKMNAAGLRRETIVVLLHNSSGVCKTDIRSVLSHLDNLRKDYTTQ